MNNAQNCAAKAQTARSDQLQSWLFDVLGEVSSFEPASSDASFRRYFRVSQGATSHIVMDAPPEQNNNEAFVELAGRLKSAGINTPGLVASDLQNGFILMEDFGPVQYLQALNTDNADRLYSSAIVTLQRMQKSLDVQGLPDYDAAFLSFEMNLINEWYFKRHRNLSLSQSQQEVLASTFALCCHSALEQPQYFTHRDYHSRNLMLTDADSPGILDFQDAVKGPLTYDIASLLRDCYISWPDEFVYRKLEQHRQLCVAAGLTQANTEQYQRWFDLMALQRHIKVVGIFCRLNLRDGKVAYMHDLPLVLHYIIDTCQKYPELADFLQLLEETGTLQEFT